MCFKKQTMCSDRHSDMKGKFMKNVRYLCDCGAINTIPLRTRLRGNKPALFYCSDCGKPSYDICKQCDNRTPSGSGHRFCQSCGAKDEAIQVGTRVIDMARHLRECVFAVPYCAGMGWLFWYGMDYIPKKPTPWFPSSFLAVAGIALLIGHLCPLYTLLTGERLAPLSWRALSRYGFSFSEHDDSLLIRQALKLRTRVKAIRRWVMRTWDKRKRKAKWLP